jgi:hypothetical protein
MSGFTPERLGSRFGEGHHKVASGLSGAAVILSALSLPGLTGQSSHPGFS